MTPAQTPNPATIPTQTRVNLSALNLDGLSEILDELDALGCDVAVVEVAEPLSCKFGIVPRGRRNLLVVWVEAGEITSIVALLQEALVFETKHREAMIAKLVAAEAGR